jgi:hypothetical protein
MPSLQDCTLPAGDTSPLPVTPPRVEPAKWRETPTFRESFLLYLTDEPLNNLFRLLGRVLYDFIQDAHRMPDWPEGVTATELRAAVGDLRHLEGYLAGVGREHEEAQLAAPDVALSKVAGRQARELARVADEIEAALDRTGA